MKTMKICCKRMALVLAFILGVLNVQAQQDSLQKPAYIVNGHFYVENKDLMNFHSQSVKSMSFINLSGGGYVVKLNMEEGFEIPAEWAKYEIPQERVKGLKEIQEKDAFEMVMTKALRDNGNKELPVGKTLPGFFELKDIDGNTWNKASLLGHKVVINCWYSGCAPCRREMPILSSWKEQFPDVLFFSADFEKADRVRKITEQEGFNWTHLVEDDYFVKFVGTGGFPLFIVLDENGIVKLVLNGASEMNRQNVIKTLKSL